ncbi:DUF1641 domain-containing protein [Granulicella arctica]|uniref:Uncharacterized protein YjgD (DUF1641 family) n=1 Tax=Granulicella arctica TaxID=940613 RepID=A0A7Y9PFY4_9BACT|nr:DUF1641 domain-containing protein [Granulicella arctica]NYF79174.1 uncharacterized protein YjgD (DUF1641 family) [Granulicella arctica]
MANPLTFKPAPVDPHLELMRRLNAAPREHAEALLVAYDVLQAAHDQGLLDLLHGAIGAKDTIFATAAKYAKTPEGITGIRNLLEAAKILTALDPAILDRLSKTLATATIEHKLEQKTPSLFQIAKRAASEDGRRALSFMTLLLTHLGRALKS